MADPKYANLTGIAYDQPDVYETDDLPEADQEQNSFEEKSDAVERLHIDAKVAFLKFNVNTLDATNVDFSDRLSRRRKTGYDANSGDWELAGSGEKETLTQKYQRLQCEMKELLDEIAAVKDSKEEEKDKTDYAGITDQVQRMLHHMSSTKLEDVLGTEICADLTDPQGAQLKKLLTQLDELTLITKSTPAKAPGASKDSNEDETVVNYKILIRPNQSQLAQTQRIVQLEQKLNKLENIVGPEPTKLARLGGKESLSEVAQTLNAKVSLLDVTRLDAIDVRLTAVSKKLEQITEKAAAISSSENEENDKKINYLYELSKKTEPLVDALPLTLSRMLALETIHQKASDFLVTVSEIETTQNELTSSIANNELLLKNLTESITTNMDAVKNTMTSFDSRIKALQAKS